MVVDMGASAAAWVASGGWWCRWWCRRCSVGSARGTPRVMVVGKRPSCRVARPTLLARGGRSRGLGLRRMTSDRPRAVAVRVHSSTSTQIFPQSGPLATRLKKIANPMLHDLHKFYPAAEPKTPPRYSRLLTEFRFPTLSSGSLCITISPHRSGFAPPSPSCSRR